MEGFDILLIIITIVTLVILSVSIYFIVVKNSQVNIIIDYSKSKSTSSSDQVTTPSVTFSSVPLPVVPSKQIVQSTQLPSVIPMTQIINTPSVTPLPTLSTQIIPITPLPTLQITPLPTPDPSLKCGLIPQYKSKYQMLSSDRSCDSSTNGVLWSDSNPDLCNSEAGVITKGTYACVPTNTYETPILFSPRISQVNWKDSSVYSNVNSIKKLLKQTYQTNFNDSNYKNDWRILNAQGGGFTKSVRVTDCVTNNVGGLFLGVKLISPTTISTDNYTKIMANSDFKNFKYANGGISSKIAFGYGYYEATYRYAQSPGVDNAFWLTNVYHDTWEGFEVDINEGQFSNSDHDTSGGLLRWSGGFNGGIGVRTNKKLVDTKVFNTFGLLYTPDVIVWYCNDTPFIKIYPTDSFTQTKNTKGEPCGFVRGNMNVKFTNGILNDKVDQTTLLNSIMNVTNFVYYS